MFPVGRRDLSVVRARQEASLPTAGSAVFDRVHDRTRTAAQKKGFAKDRELKGVIPSLIDDSLTRLLTRIYGFVAQSATRLLTSTAEDGAAAEPVGADRAQAGAL